MRLRTCKIDTALYSKLKRINENDINEAIRTLISSLHNEALEMWQNDFIKDCYKQIEKNNKDIEELPKMKESSKALFKEEAQMKINNIKLQIRALSLKKEFPSVMIATRGYETRNEWLEIEKEDYEQALKNANIQLMKIQEVLEGADKTYDESLEYDEKLEMLKKQNDRLQLEIERAQKILSNQELLNLNKEEGVDYIG